jgi:SAM-dependent methyltransferase|tara:strand:- start:9039 stop:9776 length:738 start_codon:yes stop_codon:yes gene_type:complete
LKPVLTDNPRSIQQKNQSVYDNLWAGAWLLEADNFNTWPLIQRLLGDSQARLEIAPGLRPRLPTRGTHFVDISRFALSKLSEKGGKTVQSSVCALPFADNSFDLVCALDIIEHVEDDHAAMREIARVAKTGAVVILSTPLHPSWWTQFDDFVGHYRRYEPERIRSLLKEYGLNVSKSAVFGMKPRSSGLANFGMWFLKKQPKRALWWYNRLFPHIARKQKALELEDGLIDMTNIGEIFMVCKKAR